MDRANRRRTSAKLQARVSSPCRRTEAAGRRCTGVATLRVIYGACVVVATSSEGLPMNNTRPRRERSVDCLPGAVSGPGRDPQSVRPSGLCVSMCIHAAAAVAGPLARTRSNPPPSRSTDDAAWHRYIIEPQPTLHMHQSDHDHQFDLNLESHCDAASWTPIPALTSASEMWMLAKCVILLHESPPSPPSPLLPSRTIVRCSGTPHPLLPDKCNMASVLPTSPCTQTLRTSRYDPTSWIAMYAPHPAPI